jgi:hypothetical protein
MAVSAPMPYRRQAAGGDCTLLYRPITKRGAEVRSAATAARLRIMGCCCSTHVNDTDPARFSNEIIRFKAFVQAHCKLSPRGYAQVDVLQSAWVSYRNMPLLDARTCALDIGLKETGNCTVRVIVGLEITSWPLPASPKNGKSVAYSRSIRHARWRVAHSPVTPEKCLKDDAVERSVVDWKQCTPWTLTAPGRWRGSWAAWRASARRRTRSRPGTAHLPLPLPHSLRHCLSLSRPASPSAATPSAPSASTPSAALPRARSSAAPTAASRCTTGA